MKKIYAALALIIIMIAPSCKKELNLIPPHQLVKDNAITSYDGAVSILNGMYATLALGYSTSPNNFFGGSPFVNLSSQAGVSTVGGSVFYQMSYESTNGAFTPYWQGLYACVNAANAAITGIDGLADNKFPSAEKKQQMLAEAKTFRAWANAHLLWFFGHYWNDDEYGVLWREEIVNFDNLIKDRISVRESYDKILADVEEGIKYLDSYSSAKKLSKQLAMVLKAKLLLNRGWDNDYQKALELVDGVLNESSAFSMEPDMKTMYQNAWDSKEVLWARYMEENSGRAYGEGTYSQSVIQRGDRWTTQNQNNPSSLSSFYPVFNSWLENDPRYDQTMGWARAISATGILYFCPTKLAREGRATPALMNDKFTTYYFRYPELYLMQAELRARLGQPNNLSIEPINQMRAKRVNPVLPALNVPATKDELMEVIFKEYCLELYMENGSEWFAAIRFERSNNSMFKILKPDAYPVEPNKYCWPIPSTETNTNIKIKSNPGYDN
ncbi:MAG: RagB/SusD family nutrient uptake outer membrane protein [Flavisolibacter sp.]